MNILNGILPDLLDISIANITFVQSRQEGRKQNNPLFPPFPVQRQTGHVLRGTLKKDILPLLLRGGGR